MANGAANVKTIDLKNKNNIPNITGIDLMAYFNDSYLPMEQKNKLDQIRGLKDITIIGNGNVSIDIARLLSLAKDSKVYSEMKNLNSFVSRN